MAFFGMKKIDFLFTKGDNFRCGELGKKEKRGEMISLMMKQLEILQDALASIMQDDTAPHYVRVEACAQYARACNTVPQDETK